MNENEMKSTGILVVDDEEGIRETIKDLLQIAGYANVYTARDGQECLEIMEKMGEKIQVISTCIKMPKMDGLEMIQHLVKNHKHIVGVVILTACDVLQTALDFIRLKSENVIAVDYLSKPFEPKTYLDTMRKAIEMVQVRQGKSR